MYWNTLLRIPMQAAGFVVSLVVTRLLMPDDYGIMGVAMMLIGFANLFTDFGFSSAIVQKQIRDKDTLTSIFTFNFAVSVALAAVFALSARLIAVFFKSPECQNVVIVMSSVFVITSFSAVPRAILNRDLAFKTLSLMDMVSVVLTSVFTLLLALLHYRYWALALGQLIPATLLTVYICMRVKWVPAIGYKHSSMRHILDFGFWSVVKTQLEFALSHIDKLFLGRYTGLVALGYYDKAMSIATVPSSSFISSLNAVMFSSFSKRKHNNGDVRELLKKGLMTISVLTFPVYVGLYIVAPYFVLGLLGVKWAPMIVPFQIITIGFSFRSIGGLAVALNVAVGRYKSYTLRYFFAGCVFVGLCALLVGLGTTGVALAFLVFSALSVALGLHLAAAAIDLPLSQVLGACWPAIKATTCMFIVTKLVSLGLHTPTIAHLLALSLAGAVTYIACLAVEPNPRFVELKSATIADLRILWKAWPRRTSRDISDGPSLH